MKDYFEPIQENHDMSYYGEKSMEMVGKIGKRIYKINFVKESVLNVLDYNETWRKINFVAGKWS